MGALVDINTDGLAKFAEIVGGWLGLNARAIEHKAEAEAFAAVRKVDAENAANLARLQGEEQVANYILAREKRKMNNAINVVELAQTQFTDGEQASDEPVNPDWLNRFFTIVEDVSDAEMQQLWARILAGEVKQPKSYSLRTLELLRNLSQKEAEVINKASNYLIGNNLLCADIFGADMFILSKMDELGIICGEQIMFKHFIYSNEIKDINIGGTYVLRVCSDRDIEIPVKCYHLTTVGYELFSLIKADNLKFALKFAKHFDREGVVKIELFRIIERGDAKYVLSKEDLLFSHEYQDNDDELEPVRPFVF